MDLEIIQIPMKSGELYEVSQQEIGEYEGTYTSIDVVYELKKCRMWNIKNSGRRKTKRGMDRHINSWLTGANDKAVKDDSNRVGTKQTILQRHRDRSWSNGL